MRYFNPRSHERSDIYQRLCWEFYCEFQSTLPREERHVLEQLDYEPIEFQSTLPREERPWTFPVVLIDFAISIHAPTRGATFRYEARYTGLVISIHAPTRGATRPVTREDAANKLFQSTLPREERLNRRKIDRDQGISIHAPTRGATWLEKKQKEPGRYFNPRSHERSDTG